MLHPHLHCIVPGGGLGPSNSPKGRVWKTARNKGKFLFPVKAMSKVFRAKYVEALKSRIPDLDKNLVKALFKKDWVVYAKRPFGGANKWWNIWDGIPTKLPSPTTESRP